MFFFQLRGLSEYIVRRNNFRLIERLWQDWSPNWEVPGVELENVRKTFSDPGVLKAALSYYREALSLDSFPLTEMMRERSAFRVHAPTLAITGEDDGCIDSTVFRSMMYEQDFPQGLKIKSIVGAGHFPHQERPDLVNKLILRWLNEHADSTFTK